jgi:hypothetical protein
MNIDTVMGTDTDTATKMDMVVEVDMFCFDFSYFFRDWNLLLCFKAKSAKQIPLIHF